MDGLGIAYQSDVRQTRLTAVPEVQALDISIILVSYNSEKHLKTSLDSIPPAIGDLSYEIIVVDNQSTDRSLEIVCEYPAIRLVRNQENTGFGSAANQGGNEARGEWLFFQNPDLVLDAGMLVRLHAFARGQKKDGLFVPRLRLPGGAFHPSCRNFPTVLNLFASRGSIIRSLLGRSENVYTLGDSPTPRIVPAIAGTALLVRTSFFRTLGGFDPRFFLYMEDTDLSKRSVDAGGVNWFVPDAGAIHSWQEGSRASSLNREQRHHAALALYFLKHRPGLGSQFFLVPAIWLHFFFVMMFLMLGLRRNRIELDG